MLTIGITTCYSTSIRQLNGMLMSLFDKNSTCELMKYVDKTNNYFNNYRSRSFTDINIIHVSQPVNIIIFYDANDEYNNVYSDVKELVSNIKFNNVNITLYRSYNNVKVSVARNIIIQLATTKFICFRDDDDYSVNINELLRITNKYLNYNVINCFAIYSHYNYHNHAAMMPDNVWSLIMNREFIINNNLSFIPYIGNEDIIFKTDLYNACTRYTNINNFIFVHDSIYYYTEASNRSLIDNVYDDTLDANTLKNNTKSYETLVNILQHEYRNHGVITNNYQFYRTISRLLSMRRGYVLLKHYMITHKNEFEMKDYIELISKNKGSINFWSLNNELRKNCFKLFHLFISISDLYKFTCEMKNNTSCDLSDIELLNMIINNNEEAYKILEQNKNMKYVSLDEFSYNYISYLYVAHGNHNDVLDVKLLNNIRDYICNVLKNINDSTFYLWVFNNLSVKSLMNFANKDNNFMLDCINLIGIENKNIFNNIEPYDVKHINSITDAIRYYKHETLLENYNVNPKVFMGYANDILFQLLLSVSPTDINDLNRICVTIHDNDIKILSCDCDITVNESVYRKQYSINGGCYHNNSVTYYILFILYILSVILIICVIIYSCKTMNENYYIPNEDQH